MAIGTAVQAATNIKALLALANTWTANQKIDDDKLLLFGNTSDIAMLLRSASLNANTTLSGVVEGTPITPAIPANSLIISNITDDGDIVLMVSRGGNSETFLYIDASADDLYLVAPDTGSRIVIRIDEVDKGQFTEESSAAVFQAISTSGASMRLHDSGSSSIPVFTFKGNTNTGMRRGTTDVLSFLAGGANTLSMDKDGVIVGTGVAISAGAANVMNFENGTAETTQTADTSGIFSKDVTAVATMHTQDEAETETTI